jgi:hypothetical protein
MGILHIPPKVVDNLPTYRLVVSEANPNISLPQACNPARVKCKPRYEGCPLKGVFRTGRQKKFSDHDEKVGI